MSRILIVDDEESICWAFREFLGDEGYTVDVAASAEEGLRLADSARPDAVVLDVRLPGMDGLTALRAFHDLVGTAPVIVMTAFGSLDTAVRAIEGGAFDYLVKPFDLDDAAALVRRALERTSPEGPSAPQPPTIDDGEMVGSSAAMQQLFKKIALVAPAEVPVLITGESGTGKELVARAVHRYSMRRDGPFLPVCLPSLSPTLIERELFGHIRGSFTGADHDSKGFLELAQGGTVLLDEVGDIPPDLQVKLLRAIEHQVITPVGEARPRTTDFRVIAATNRPLGELMAAGRFREDLFFRLSVFPIHVPPLRERRDDIPALAEHFLRRCRKPAGAEARISEDLQAVLRARPWTGNVRELRNAIEHAAIVARGRELRPEHLPPPGIAISGEAVSPRDDLQTRIAAWALAEMNAGADREFHERFLDVTEPPLLRSALAHSGGNRAAAAELLGIHRATLRQKLRRHGIE